MGKNSLKRLLDGFLRHRFAWLFAVLLFSIGLQPAVAMVAPRTNLVEWVLAATLVAAIGSAATSRGIRALIVLSLAFAVLHGLRAAIGGEGLVFAGEFVWIVACTVALAALARQAFRDGEVDAERIFAALDAYLMAGLIFGVCFLALERTWPASFGAPAVSDLDLSSSVYFSFVTIATLGYGDITPVSEAARGLAVFEAVAGQLYIAVLVARLVGLYTVSAGNRVKG